MWHDYQGKIASTRHANAPTTGNVEKFNLDGEWRPRECIGNKPKKGGMVHDNNE